MQPAEPGHTYLGAYGICLRDGHLLLAHIPATSPIDPDAWTLPGGGIDFREHPDDAVLRELREEAGLTGVLEGLVAAYSHVYERSDDRPRPPVHHIGFIYSVAVDPGDLVAEIEGSTDYCRWFLPAEARDLTLTPLAAFALSLPRFGVDPVEAGALAATGGSAGRRRRAKGPMP